MNTNPLVQTSVEEETVDHLQDASDNNESTDLNFESVENCSVEAVEAIEAVEAVDQKSTEKTVIDQIGQLTRTLHDSLRELGYDQRLQSITDEVPEAQDRLSYVATKTEQAAERALSATEIAMPIQEKLSNNAVDLSSQWKEALESKQSQPDTEKFKELLIATLTYLNEVPKQTDATNAQLMEIMMAQDFQDLTGQVIKKITVMVQNLENELVQLLVANVPSPVNKANEGLLNGPIVNPEKHDDVVSSQDQVDDLLASLGF